MRNHGFSRHKPEVINTAEGKLCVDHIEIDDGIHTDCHGIPGQDLKNDRASEAGVTEE